MSGKMLTHHNELSSHKGQASFKGRVIQDIVKTQNLDSLDLAGDIEASSPLFPSLTEELDEIKDTIKSVSKQQPKEKSHTEKMVDISNKFNKGGSREI